MKNRILQEAQNISITRWTMKRIVLAVVLVLFAVGNVFAFGSSKFEDELEKETGAVKLVREVQRGGYGIIATEELDKAIKAGDNMLIIDTMPFDASYAKGHVPGAKQFLFPIPDMTEWNAAETDNKSVADYQALLGADKNKKIVVYCGFVKCTRSHNGAAWAVKLGYTNVYRYPGGIYAWKGANLAEEKVE
jgi:thiosulfate/3-mercaptopyruvate sulfurtransferase